MTTSEHRRTSAGGCLGARTWTAVLAGLTLVMALVPATPPTHALPTQTIGFAGDENVEEDDDAGEVELTVELDDAVPPGMDVTFTWCTLLDDGADADPATAGSDYMSVEAKTTSLETATHCSGAAAADGTGEDTIPADATSTVISVPVIDDDEIEGPETFRVVLEQVTSSGGETVDDARRNATVTIEDDDPKLTIGDVEVAEGDSGITDAVFTVSLSTPFPADGPDVVFGYHTEDDGTAESGTDFQDTSVAADDPGAPRIVAGETSTSVTVGVIGDTEPDGGSEGARTETFSVVPELPDGSPAFLGDSGTGTILDDDCRPKVYVADASIGEGDSGDTTDLAFPVHIVDTKGNECATRADLTVEYQTSDSGTSAKDREGFNEDDGTGGDFEPQPDPDSEADTASITIPAGAVSAEIPITVIGDDKYEDDETFELTGITIAGGPADICSTSADGCDDSPTTAVGTIENDDTIPHVSVGDVALEEGSAFETAFEFPVTLSNPSHQDITVNWATGEGTATPDEDYTAGSGELEIDAGTAEGTATVFVEPDDDEEPDETFFVLLSANGSSDGAYVIDDGEGQGTIINDDGPQLEITQSASTLEGDDGTTELTFTVTLSEARTDGKDVTVDVATSDGTATETLDYEPESTTLEIPAGETAAELAVAVVGDTEPEDDETFTVTLSNPTNAVIRPGRGEGTGEILDDDGGSSDGPTAVIDGDTDGLEGAELTFDGSGSSAADGTITEYAWAFSDGSPSDRGSSITHAFPDDGTYTVALRVTDGSGSTDIAEMQVSVTNADPAAEIEGPTSVEVFETATFTAAATDAGNDELSFAWDLGGGVIPSSGESATHTFSDTGSYDVTLEVTDDDGGVGTDTMTVQVTPDSGQVGRDAGPDRISTAVAVSQAHWDAADDAVLATAGNYPDALAGGPLAAKLGAPLLLTPTDTLDDAVRGELKRLGVERVWVLGGPAAISQAVEDQLTAAGYAVHRFQGPDRFVTAAVIAAGLGASPDGEVAIALGSHADPNRAWPDALSAGALAATDGHIPTLLTAAEELPFATVQALEFMDARKVFLLGGTAAISPTVEQQLTQLGYQVTRLAGTNRYATSVAVASEALERHPDDQFAVPIVFATGENFPDGLAATALAARMGGVLLLVPGTGNAEDVSELQRFLSDNVHRLDVGRVVGGSAVLTEQVRAQLESAIGGPGHE